MKIGVTPSCDKEMILDNNNDKGKIPIFHCGLYDEVHNTQNRRSWIQEEHMNKPKTSVGNSIVDKTAFLLQKDRIYTCDVLHYCKFVLPMR